MNNVKLILGRKFFNNEAKWADISDLFFNKCVMDTQCSERYLNILDKSVKYTPWTYEEDTLLL